MDVIGYGAASIIYYLQIVNQYSDRVNLANAFSAHFFEKFADFLTPMCKI
jgi:hypothetical protein